MEALKNIAITLILSTIIIALSYEGDLQAAMPQNGKHVLGYIIFFVIMFAMTAFTRKISK